MAVKGLNTKLLFSGKSVKQFLNYIPTKLRALVPATEILLEVLMFQDTNDSFAHFLGMVKQLIIRLFGIKSSNS